MKIEAPKNIIVNEGGELRSLHGKEAIECMRLRTILIGLKSEAHGMRLTRGVNCTQMAQELTGLKTRDRTKLAERVQLMLDNQVSKCLVVDLGEGG